MLHRVVGSYRRTVLLEGRITFDGRHPLLRSHLAGFLVPSQPHQEPVRAMLSEAVAKAHAAPDGSVEVLVAHAPGREYCFVIGTRPPA
jgi:hypothetical protein